MNTAIKPRGRQAKPTRHEVSAAWDRLRSAADGGDLQANALLIALVENKPLSPVLERARA